MKVYRILGLCAAMVLPQLALAELPMPVESLGTVEGTLAFCAEVNPQAAAQYNEFTKLLTKDAPAQEVQEARQSSEYRQAHENIRAELAKTQAADAVKACSAFLEPPK
jgi:hypothetical protein